MSPRPPIDCFAFATSRLVSCHKCVCLLVHLTLKTSFSLRLAQPTTNREPCSVCVCMYWSPARRGAHLRHQSHSLASASPHLGATVHAVQPWPTGLYHPSSCGVMSFILAHTRSDTPSVNLTSQWYIAEALFSFSMDPDTLLVPFSARS